MKIDRHIPPPTNLRADIPPGSHPFRRMDVGDSVLFPHEPKGYQSAPAAYARKFGQRSGKKFVTRKEGDGVRVWRIE